MAQDIAALVSVFLPPDPDQMDVAFQTGDDVDVLSASLGSFSVAAQAVMTRLDRPGRHEFCRRVADLSDGALQPWMVEATLRSTEGDRDALAGTDPLVMSGIHLYGLYLIASEYLSHEECQQLRPRAENRAAEFRPLLAALPQ